MLPGFAVPTRVYSRLGIRTTVPEHARRLGGSRVVLVGDAGLQRVGVLDQFAEALHDTSGVEFVGAIPSKVDPSISDAEEAANTAIEHRADLVLGVGGGSALSLAKAVALLIRNSSPIAQYAGVDLAPNSPAPCIAVPTTAGSGSEVSNAFVLYDSESSHNVGFRGWGYEPDIALLDGDLLLGLPLEPMRDAAIDALSHGFEALWARGATRFSDTAAMEAVRLIRRTLPRALRNRDRQDLQTLLEASTLANFGCGNAGLGLVHALSSSSSIRIPHGRQNTVLLPVVAAFNRGVVSAGVTTEIDLLDRLYEEAGIPTGFEQQELIPHAAQAMVDAARESPFRSNNLRETSEEQLTELATRATRTTASA